MTLEHFMLGGIAFSVICFFIAWRQRYCNDRTFADRMAIIDAGAFDLLRRVTYEQHLNARFFFRDPWKLYERDEE